MLLQPSEQYVPIFDTLREKTFLSKTVIEILEEDSGERETVLNFTVLELLTVLFTNLSFSSK